jgi:inorganic pyrophosphatase
MDTFPIPVSQIVDILNAMHWVIAPYHEDDPTFSDHPHIKELAENYNRLLELFSKAYSHTFTPF